MSVSDAQPVSPEPAERLARVGLTEKRWDDICRVLIAAGLYADVQEITGQVWPLPTKLGAVIRAVRLGEASDSLYVRAAVTHDEWQLLAWRSVDTGDWVHGTHLHALEILAPGVDV